MLVFTRRLGESPRTANDVIVTPTDIKDRSRVGLGIQSPESAPTYPNKLYDRLQAERPPENGNGE